MKLLKHFLAVVLLSPLLLSGCVNHFYTEVDLSATTDSTYNTLQDISISSYTDWTYINLETGETEVIEDGQEWYYTDGTIREAVGGDDPTIDWHIAIHRYDLRTNGASVIDAGTTDITLVTSLPSGTYTEDEYTSYEVESELDDGRVLTMDMSGMMSGVMGYLHYYYINRELCNCITRTATGSMPPYTYEANKEVYALKWDDGTWATLQCTLSTHSTKGTTGYLSFNYKFHD